MPLAIDTAGIHPATESCFELLQFLSERYDFARILDMGCGNGILSLAAASIWGAQVTAVDISEQAIVRTKENMELHGLQAQITPLRSDGFNHAKIHENAPYDLIIFNLLAEPIVRMAPDVRSHLAPGGIAIISGILTWMAEGTQLAYQGLGFEKIKEISRSPWHSYVMQLQDSVVTKA